jgi:hypothetical protein
MITIHVGGNPVIGPRVTFAGTAAYVVAGPLTPASVTVTITCATGLTAGSQAHFREIEVVDVGTTGNIITGWATISGDNSYQNATVIAGGLASVSATIDTSLLDDGDVVRIECWKDAYPGSQKLGELYIYGGALSAQLLDAPGTASATSGTGGTADGYLRGRVTIAGTGVNGIPLVLTAQNSLTNDKYTFSATPAVNCTTLGDVSTAASTTTVSGPGPGTVQVEVHWRCDGGGGIDSGSFRVTWDANGNGIADVPGEPSVTVIQTASGPMS